MERPILATIEEHNEGEHASARVVLGYQDEIYEGSSEGAPAEEGRPRLIGEATLRAAEKLLDDIVRFELEAVATTDLGNVRVAMAQVRTEGASYVGSAALRENDPARATARAVLDAINRRLSQALIDLE